MRAWIVACVLCGCASERPPSERCGDGVLGTGEVCDDGDSNGTETSWCTRGCTQIAVQWTSSEVVDLPLPGRKVVPWSSELVVSNFDSDGIAIIPFQQKPPVFLKKYSKTLDFTVIPWGTRGTVVWAEAAIPGIGGPWLLYADLSETPPVARDLGFASNDIRDISFVSYGFGFTQADVLQRARPSGQFAFSATPIGSFSGNLIATLGINTQTDLRVVYHVNDGSSNSLIVTSELNANATPDIIAEYTWSKSITDWSRGPDFQGSTAALIDGTGVVELIPLQDDGGTETLDGYYGTMPEGTLGIAGGRDAVLGIDRKGTISLLIHNGNGRSMRPLTIDIGPPCEVCSFADSDDTPEWFIFDRQAVRGVISY